MEATKLPGLLPYLELCKETCVTQTEEVGNSSIGKQTHAAELSKETAFPPPRFTTCPMEGSKRMERAEEQTFVIPMVRIGKMPK